MSTSRKKAPNKSIKFVINQKSVSISQNKGFPEKCDFTRSKKLLPFESVSEKKRKRFLLAETRFFKIFDVPLIAIMVSKINVNERI